MGVEVWSEAPLDELLVEGDRVVVERAKDNGRPAEVCAGRGVVFGTGSFDHNEEMRGQDHGISGE